MSFSSFILSPAVWLSSRLSFSRKLGGAFVLFALPLAAAAGWIGVHGWESLERLRLQRAGLAGQVPALVRVRQAQESYASAIGRALVDPAASAGAGAEAAGVQRDAYPDLRERHESGVAQELARRDAIAAKARLALVDDAAAQAIVSVLNGHLPRLLSSVGQARNLGYAVVIRKRLTGRERESLTLERSRMQPLMAWIQEDLVKAGNARPELRPALETAFSSLTDSGLGLQEFLTTKVLNSADYDVEPAAYLARGTLAAEGALDFARALQPLLDGILSAEEARLSRLAALAGAGFAVLLLLLAWLFAGAYVSILRSLRGLEAAAGAMAGGDLTARAGIETRDELGHVAERFNAMADAFCRLIDGVIQAAGDTRNAASNLTGQAAHVTEASAGQCEKAAESASSMQQLAVSVSQVAAHAADTDLIVAQAVELSAEGRRIAGDAIGEMHRVAEDIRGAVEAVSLLEARSQSVARIVKVISEIADQTNLLALNAAIEAARAGETGRGFAVVADEVRRLADRTRQSTGEIDRTIRDMENGIAEVVARIREGDLRVVESSRVIGDVGDALATINAEVLRSSALIREIVNATRAQSEVGQQIACSIETMARMAEANHDTARRTANSVDGLNQLSQTLRRSVDGLKIGTGDSSLRSAVSRPREHA